ncbi:MAG TPA: hypothetical protein VMR70_18225 [Flavisolibacter sp.]|nr:hypothetical protein [Flavisolibacter sp.]
MTTKDGFEIKFVFLAYVPPYDAGAAPSVLKTEVIKTAGKTTDYLFKIFDASFNESTVEILFNSDGKQNNDIRSLILAIAQKTKSADKKKYADRLAHALYNVTDQRNGTGLFAVIIGAKDHITRLVLARFKGDDGLVNKSKNLLIDYVSEVFTKRSNHYKLAVFQDILSDKSFWKAYSIDKQLTASNQKQISIFWVEKFLQAKTALTSAQGTIQFSKAIKGIISTSVDLNEQEEIITGVINLRHKSGAKISISDFCDKYLSPNTAVRLKESIKDKDFLNSVFEIDREIYRKEFGKTVLAIQDGIIVYVPTFQYEKHVTEVANNDGTKNVIIKGRLNSKKMNAQSKLPENVRQKRNTRN